SRRWPHFWNGPGLPGTPRAAHWRTSRRRRRRYRSLLTGSRHTLSICGRHERRISSGPSTWFLIGCPPWRRGSGPSLRLILATCPAPMKGSALLKRDASRSAASGNRRSRSCSTTGQTGSSGPGRWWPTRTRMSTSKLCLWGDRMDLIGIENEAEFFPSGTLSDVLKEELQDITARWAGLDRTAHPVERLARVAGPTVEALRQVRNSTDRSRRAELVRDAHHDVLAALGYVWRREGAYTALDGAPVIPLVSRAADASGRDALWVIEAPIPAPEDEASDPVGACFEEDQFPPDQREAALTDR